MILTESLFLMRQLCLKWLEKPVYIKKCKHERKQGCGRLNLLWAFPFYFSLLLYVGSQSPLYLSTRILTGVQLRSKTQCTPVVHTSVVHGVACLLFSLRLLAALLHPLHLRDQVPPVYGER